MAEDTLEQFKDRFFLAGKIDRFEDKMAVIILADSQKLLWPIKDLPEDSEAGAEVRLILSTAKSDEQERERTAKAILNEILKNSGQNGAKQPE
ncbi:MAG: hypothetical protein A3J65_03855 [Candidatus Buchananbacteria bacterium RIFCSPHIGHO2_02_FULL_45_11b]|uniref:DUF3006 domain-containing protein n=4 Tax=Candidatus Buchananiibacteriota TaxID=1817903 RepID=A0A1G1YL01_9BACT|nr:MAG: hypothetical protein A2663_00685 [Candidatus Buchananbacteria bacterium RIFCSPHIGHO2_01_FULL_46_12]OGY51755.1 MAG: hypothetical protein A3J65_03855 [Candidatus Buchananbacteria bacterium RIFCSPHIGHO2_02_FULL_45_11b]OGY52989.1 MAG: hypothetical protein A3B15_03045 [Candidatus Buchananbacteria bacterium RIFCSPLOWO2_01_FULL_45_31]OGY56446.1 MAG: hypothetical protein A3H67_05255 [Candidatus Buchananbacteria bacterium RIFCSPLOWO2_02_FULL_46_11b]